MHGRCPDKAWAEEFKVKKVMSKDALKLFFMRTSKPVRIGRNGVFDSQLQISYWDEWMVCEKGQYAQLYSRVGIATKLETLTDEDKKAIIFLLFQITKQYTSHYLATVQAMREF